MNRTLNRLHPYPFERLNILLEGMDTESNLPLIAWSVGEPKHPAPDFLVEGDLSGYRHMKLVEQQNPQNITVLSVSSGTSLVTWPAGQKPLKLNSTYKIILAGAGESLPLQETFQTTAVRRDRKASSLVIVDLSDGN